LQRQLHADYQPDRFLRDQLVKSADIPEIARSMKEKPPKTSHAAEERIAALLSAQPGSASKSFMCDDGCSTDDQTVANYGSGRRFGGAAKKGGSVRRKHDNRNQLRSTLAKVDGCWVCSGDHFAYQKHSKGEIQTALKTLKEKAVKTYVSVDSVYAAISASFVGADDECGDVDEDDRQANLEIVESMADVSFQCRSSYESDSYQSRSITRGDLAFESEDPSSFKGIILNTGANRASTMSREQYNTYCKMFGSRDALRRNYQAMVI
jgi:hypothetical protein